MKTEKKYASIRSGMVSILVACIMIFTAPSPAGADTAREIDVSVEVALEKFTKEVRGANELLQASKGVLVFPRVYKAGFLWLGGEYGEGGLRIDGKTADYYSIVAGSLGPQLGAQVKTVVLVFLQQEALDHFRRSEGWKAGVDGSIAVADEGVGQAVDSTMFRQPIIGFIIDQKGLMGNLTLEGAKFTRMPK